MVDKKVLHLVPQILQDRAEAMIKESSLTASDNIAQQLEVVASYCNEMLTIYHKRKLTQTTPRMMKLRHHGS